ncbi:MAG: hypothetical protein ACRDRP_18480 [Pseudonocardiaceae bacterium]
MKTNTTLTMEDTVLAQARQAAAEGRTLSAWAEFTQVLRRFLPLGRA